MSERRTKHTQVPCLINGEWIDVDEELQPLLAEMSYLGIKTTFSCQGDAHFVDQTEWEGKRYRAYIQMERDATSIAFVQDLLANFYAFRANKVSWSIDFDRNPSTDENRICIRFPQKDIAILWGYLKMKSMKTTIEKDD